MTISLLKMSKTKKKVVVTTSAKSSKKTEPTVSRRKSSSSSTTSKSSHPLIFNKSNYILMLGGIGLIALGLILMSGGGMPSPDIWDESIIYSWRRTVLAPIVIVSGLVLEIYAIFKRTDQEKDTPQ